MGQILSHLSGYSDNGEIKCTEETLKEAVWKIAKSNIIDRTIALQHKIQIRGMFGYVEEGNEMIQYEKMSPLIAACRLQDAELVQKLVSMGADVNAVMENNDQRWSVPAIFVASSRCNVDIVEILIKAGADVNSFRGKAQCINLQKPESDQYAVILPKPCRYEAYNLYKIVELYLYAGIKINSTSWGPCLFYGRGKEYEANFPTTLNIPCPYFFCNISVLLLQHGVNPNLYRLSDVIYQYMGDHNRFKTEEYCVDRGLLVWTFLAAGYEITSHEKELLNKNIYTCMDQFMNFIPPMSLKHLARVSIRKHISNINGDTTIFPVIDKLNLPNLLKDYLKLLDVIDADISRVICRKQRYSY